MSADRLTDLTVVYSVLSTHTLGGCLPLKDHDNPVDVPLHAPLLAECIMHALNTLKFAHLILRKSLNLLPPDVRF